MESEELLVTLVDLVDRLREEVTEARKDVRLMWDLLSPMVSALRLDSEARTDYSVEALRLLRRMAPQPEPDPTSPTTY